MTKSKFLTLFKERGYFHQCTDLEALDNLLFEAEKSGEGITAYIGFDCTAASLHVGSLMQIMILRWLQKCGHKPIILLGGATTKIGDPSGKDESRPKITDEKISENMAGIRNVFDQFGLQTANMVNNNDWLSKISYLDLLSEYGRHFSVNKMLSFDSVKLRLEREQHLSFLEFNYMILQAYDFVELNTAYGCRLQIGGSDQWGNIVNGVELNRKILTNKVGLLTDQDENDRINIQENGIFGLTTPLVTTSSGTKMGKTAAGAVWLSQDMLSPYDYWQFWRNTEDKDVFKFMRLFTEISIEEIAQIESTMQGADINKAKIILANAATEICHGLDAAKHAEETARKTFEQGGFGDDLPVVEVSRGELEAGIRATELFQRAKLVKSGGEAKDLIKGGGAKVNDIKISDMGQNITLVDLKEGVIKLSAGKKKHALVKITE